MEYHIAAIPGDGIGPEVTQEAQKVLDAVGAKFGHSFKYTKVLAGGCSIDKYGVPLTEEALGICRENDAVLLGAVGGDVSTSPWYKRPANERPEAGLMGLRKGLALYCNIRPSYLYKELADRCPLRPDIVRDGFDMVIMRELTGGLYFGERYTKEISGKMTAVDTLIYNEDEIRRIAHKAFGVAMKRRKNLISVDKANVLDSSRLWRRIVNEVAEEYPQVTVSHMLVDNCAMQIIRNPGQFDVMLTENMFGDILSDEASEIAGSLGMQPSASLADGKFGMYEPSHGSAPDIAGRGIANPLAAIMSASMMLRYSFDLDEAADSVAGAVQKVLADGYRTADISEEGAKTVGSSEMGDAVCDRL